MIARSLIRPLLAVHCVRVSLFSGMERWNGMVEWNGGMEWNGIVERSRPLRAFRDDLHRLCWDSSSLRKLVQANSISGSLNWSSKSRVRWPRSALVLVLNSILILILWFDFDSDSLTWFWFSNLILILILILQFNFDFDSLSYFDFIGGFWFSNVILIGISINN